MRALLTGLFIGCLVCFASAQAEDLPADAGTGSPCASFGGDAGTRLWTVSANAQFMVSCDSDVRYRVCAPGACVAISTDAPIAGGKQVDLCAPTGKTSVSLWRAYDAGPTSTLSDGGTSIPAGTNCCVYRTSPKTVCQVNSP